MKGKTKQVKSSKDEKAPRKVWSSLLPQKGEGCFTSLVKIFLILLIVASAFKSYPLIIAVIIVYLINKKVNFKSKSLKVVTYIFVILTGVIFTGVVLSNTSEETRTSTPSVINNNTNSDNNKKAEEPVVEEKKDPDPITLTGKGDSVTEKQILVPGYALLTITNSGKSNFVLYSHSSDDDTELLVNRIGIYSGTRLLKVNEGQTYFFEISSSGDWSIVITQPTKTTITAPITLSGNGDSVQLVNMNKGDYKLTLTHSGKSNFIVYFVDQYTSFYSEDLVVNDIGAYSGTNLIKASKNGVYFLNITANGNWTAKIE